MSKGVLSKRTPLEALNERGIELPEMDPKKISGTWKAEKCETCGKIGSYRTKLSLSICDFPTATTEKDSRVKVVLMGSSDLHNFCSKECIAAWMVKNSNIPLTFKDRVLFKIKERMLKTKIWWYEKILLPAAYMKDYQEGFLLVFKTLGRGYDSDIKKFYARYIDKTMFDKKLAEEFPEGLLLVSLTENAPRRDQPFGWGARFLVRWPNVLTFGRRQEKIFQIYRHMAVDLKRMIEIAGTDSPGSKDKIPFADLADKDPGIGIFIPLDEKIAIQIGIKRYAVKTGNEIVAVDEICDASHLQKDQNGKFYLPHHIELEWGPDPLSQENYEYQFNKFLEAARLLAKLQEKREIEQVLTTGEFTEETKADIILFQKNWRQWMAKHTPSATA